MRGSQEEAGRLVAQVVSASGGSVYGRVRLQKMFYLLDRIGLGSELDYEYHYYGPYSAELTEQIKDAVAVGFIEETPARRASDGVPYSVFGRPTVELGESLGALDRRTSERALVRMQGESATVLELAATIDWLQTREEVPDWQRELFRRKGAKAESGRVDRALGLLRDCTSATDRAASRFRADLVQRRRGRLGRASSISGTVRSFSTSATSIRLPLVPQGPTYCVLQVACGRNFGIIYTSPPTSTPQ